MNMNDAQVREVVDGAIREMRMAMGLSRWHVNVNYRSLADDDIGTCLLDVPHYRATVELDPAKHEDADEVLKTLRHELLHVCHAYFEVPRGVVGEYLSTTSFNAVDVSFKLAAEHTVASMEWLLDDQGITPRKLVERGAGILANFVDAPEDGEAKEDEEQSHVVRLDHHQGGDDG